MKEKIGYHALRLFDKNGFHGTSMRDIGNASGCKTPTVYHYYASKENLFDEVVRVAYLNLVDELRNRLQGKMSPKDFCVQTIMQKKHLSEDELLIHRLAMKTWLGFEGCDETRRMMLEWETTRSERNKALLSDAISSKTWVSIITRTYMQLVERIVLFNENISDDEIIDEMTLVFEAAYQYKKEDF